MFKNFVSLLSGHASYNLYTTKRFKFENVGAVISIAIYTQYIYLKQKLTDNRK
jgi:hypothetical protein